MKKIWQMDISDDNLYVMGVIEGNDTNNEIGYGSINLPLTKESSLLVSKMSMELEPVWARLYPGDAVGGASILQNLNLTVSGNDIWLGGMFNGKLSDDADAANSIATLAKNPREGFVILADATDGHWVKGMTTATSYANKGIAGVFHVFTNVEDDSKFYIFGYDWAKDRGIFIREYEKATFESDPATQNWNIITQGGAMAVSNDLAIQGNKLFTLTRSAKSSNAPVLSGGANADITLATSEGFGVVVGAFEMPFKATSGIEDNLAGVSSVKVFGAEGVLHVVADKAVSVDVYNLLGQRVARVEAEEGDNTVALPAGIYIADKVKVVVR